VSHPLSSVSAFAQRCSSPAWNRQAPSSVVAAARSAFGSGRPPIARSAITAANVDSVATTMARSSLRRVASATRRSAYSTVNCISSTGTKWLSIRP
jgi:hypothetical protein